MSDVLIKEIDFSPEQRPRDCAQALQNFWSAHAVFHLRGLKIDTDVRDFYGQMVSGIGELKPLAEDARVSDRAKQRTGEVWFEVRNDPSIPNNYRHASVAQPLHTDGSYIPDFPNAGLLACVANCADGGETTFLGGAILVDILRRKAPDLLTRLREIELPHRRSGDFRSAPVVRESKGETILNWNYYCVDPAAPAQVTELREDFFRFLRDEAEVGANLHAVKLAPGDAVIWKDDRVLHGRNAFHPERTSARFLWKAAVEIRA